MRVYLIPLFEPWAVSRACRGMSSQQAVSTHRYDNFSMAVLGLVQNRNDDNQFSNMFAAHGTSSNRTALHDLSRCTQRLLESELSTSIISEKHTVLTSHLRTVNSPPWQP